jgi:hypothetical protein
MIGSPAAKVGGAMASPPQITPASHIVPRRFDMARL